MQFEIIIHTDKKYKMQVKRVYEGDTVDRFEVSAGGKVVTLQTNYHYLKKTNQRKAADWKIISGDVKNGVAFALTIQEIERHFKEMDWVAPDRGK